MSSSRRNFLKTSAGFAAAASAARPTSAASYRRILGANDRIHMGIIGVGGMGTGHLHAFCNLKANS